MPTSNFFPYQEKKRNDRKNHMHKRDEPKVETSCPSFNVRDVVAKTDELRILGEAGAHRFFVMDKDKDRVLLRSEIQLKSNGFWDKEAAYTRLMSK